MWKRRDIIPWGCRPINATYHEYATKQGCEQSTQIADEAVDRIKGQEWEDLEQLDPEYCCCSEERKAKLKLQIM
jgi:hypothetical protein